MKRARLIISVLGLLFASQIAIKEIAWQVWGHPRELKQAQKIADFLCILGRLTREDDLEAFHANEVTVAINTGAYRFCREAQQ